MTLNARSSRRVVVNTGNVPQIEMQTTAEQAIYVKVYAGDPLTGDLQLLSIGSDYTLSGIGPSTTSFIVNILNPLTWDVETYPRFAVFVDYPVNQPSDVGLGGVFGARYEAALDRIVLNMQTMDDKLDRAIKAPITGTVDDEYGVALTPTTLLGVDAAGALTNYTPAEFADLVLNPAALVELLTLTLAALPNRPDGDITGLAIGQLYWSGGYLARVQP